MNEIYGLAPNSLSTANEYRLFLNSFGPHSSKYLLAYPDFNSWQSLLLTHFETARDIERERIKSVLRKGKDSHTFIASGRMSFFQQDRSWIHNAIDHWTKQSSDYKTIFVSDDDFSSLLKNLPDSASGVIASAFENPPAASTDEFIDTTPEVYWRACKILCLLSREIHIVDPYLNPLKRDCKSIFTKFITEIGKLSKVQSISFWTRLANLQNYSGSSYKQDISRLIESSLTTSDKQMKITLNLVNDETSSDKLHARYLISNVGGIKLDQGFQQLPADRKNMVSTMSSALHEEVFRKFSTSSFDFKVAEKIVVGK